jgi:protein-L-isoaspartate(D-aspartate) O-methyltransferase
VHSDARAHDGEQPTAEAALDLNANMVDRAKANGAIRSAEVEAAFRAIPRHLFLPTTPLEKVYSGAVIVTRTDEAGQPISSSSEVGIMAPMLEDLHVCPGQKVLEIGAGTGYNAALLDQLVGVEGEVVTVDLDPQIASEARAHLAEAGHARVRVVVGDGYAGYPDRAPYDRMIATASVPDLPRAWLDQLREGGRLTVPLRLGATQLVITFRREGEALESVSLIAGGFMSLRSQQFTDVTGVTLEGEWEVVSPTLEEGDPPILTALLHDQPSIEPVAEMSWQATFLLGLLEPDWITVRQRQRAFGWSGVYDRPSRSLALTTFVGLPMRIGRVLLLSYGPPAARERLLRLIEHASGVAVRDLRITAVPIDRPAPRADVVVPGRAFRYAITRTVPPPA